MTEIPRTYLKIWLSDIIKEIKLIKTELTELGKMKEEKTASPAAGKYQLVGFKDVRETIKGRLLGGSRNLDVILIIGMPGIVKTALAQSFKDDKAIVSHFSFFGECRVSQVYTRRYLLLSILNDVNDERTYRSEDGDCSRIILTTRHQIVSSNAKCFTDPYHLRMLTGEESWSLLQRKAFGEEICPDKLKEVGKEIAKKCKGLPLSIVLVGGLLARMEKKEQCWKQMELSLGAKIEDESKDLVQVSYKNLPHKMKPCFLYFGAFLENREISVSKFTNLWIAEGLIENDKEKSLEDIAEEYLEDLVGRNLVIVTKSIYNGKLKDALYTT
ncbi:putative late blight resistance protein homolog R1A-10 [Nicotiana sylvestris]|uniref:putative late blight resistance protein homolog R1A-10 n=1 Tax=Nicotiana sylvestris TaxID=4096 RepID=UPI00388CB8C8